MAKELLLAVFATVLSPAVTAFAAHPLITDDTGTQGKGRTQLEFTGEYDHDSDDGFTTNTFIFPAIPVISYGIADTVDLVLGVPYEWRESKQNGIVTTESGILDVSIQLKWRFQKKDGLSFAVKPGVTLPTGDEGRGLGNGKASYSTFFITTKERAPWALHFNVGYIRNEYKLRTDEAANRKDLWHVSLASEVEIIKNLKAVANIGMERNLDKRSNTDPSFLLGGVIYSTTDSFDIDMGVKAGLNEPAADITYLTGVTKRF